MAFANSVRLSSDTTRRVHEPLLLLSRIMSDEAQHRDEVKKRVQMALASSATDLHEILAGCHGADPRIVAEWVGELGTGHASAREHLYPTRETFLQLPAADPFRSQWWFSGETIEFITDRVVAKTTAGGGRVLCLGAPTVGHLLLGRGVEACGR